MSITKDFEECRCTAVPGFPTMFYWDDVGYLLRHARALEAMLKLEHEKNRNIDGIERHRELDPECVVCKLLD